MKSRMCKIGIHLFVDNEHLYDMDACMYVHMHAYLYIERDVREAAYICAYSLKFCGIDNC